MTDDRERRVVAWPGTPSCHAGSAEEAVEAFGDGRGVTVFAGGTILMPDVAYGRYPQGGRTLMLTGPGWTGSAATARAHRSDDPARRRWRRRASQPLAAGRRRRRRSRDPRPGDARRQPVRPARARELRAVICRRRCSRSARGCARSAPAGRADRAGGGLPGRARRRAAARARGRVRAPAPRGVPVSAPPARALLRGHGGGVLPRSAAASASRRRAWHRCRPPGGGRGGAGRRRRARGGRRPGGRRTRAPRRRARLGLVPQARSCPRSSRRALEQLQGG